MPKTTKSFPFLSFSSLLFISFSLASPNHHEILKSSCSDTLYPSHCFSSISSHPDAKSEAITRKGVIHLALAISQDSIHQTYSKISSLASSSSNFTSRENVALRDCLELLNKTIYELDMVSNVFRDYCSSNKTLANHVDHLSILLSAAITNQNTCLDGFSHDQVDRKIRELFISDEENVIRQCSNALAMVKKMTDADLAREERSRTSSRKNLDEINGVRWPKWLSAGDQRLLRAKFVRPDVVVAADGSGDHRSVSEAVDAAPSWSKSRYIIKIKAGVYRENVNVPIKKTNIMFVGDGRRNTFITGNRSVGDGSTTFKSATVAVVGAMFLARDITFHNSAGPSKEQAVALRVGSDQSAFYRCSMVAFQDTLYVHSLRQFYISCVIIGTVDFIFGNAAVVLQNCDIHARRPNPGQKNMITAQSRDDPHETTGIVIQKCRIRATNNFQGAQSSVPTYLGRPWRKYSRTVVMQSEISEVIHPAGWHEWSGDFALDTLEYREYLNTGPGANVRDRVRWKGFKVMTSDAEAKPFTAENLIGGSGWLPSTGFPFSLGL